MFTYGYQVTLTGGPHVPNEDKDLFARYLKSMIDMGIMPDIGTDPSMRFITESAAPGYDKDGRLIDVTVHTNTPMSKDFYEKAKDMIVDAVDQAWYQISKDDSIEIMAQGKLQVLGRTGNLPAKLYYITDKAGIDSILKEGLLPKQGENSYRNDENFMYLADLEQLPVWMDVLKSPEDAVLLEIDPRGITGIERGRTFEDREYIERFSEYRTRDPCISRLCAKSYAYVQ